MSQQPFAGPLGPGGTGGKPTPPTDEHMRTALEPLLRALLNETIKSWTTQTGATKSLDARLAHLAPERRAIWIAEIKKVVIALRAKLLPLTAQLAGSVDAALVNAKQVKYANLTDDQVVAADPTTLSILDSFLHATPIMAALDIALQGLSDEVTAYVTRSQSVETWLAGRKQWCAQEYGELDILVQQVDATLHTIDTLQLGPFLTVWTGPVITFHKAAAVVLATPLDNGWKNADTALCAAFTEPEAALKQTVGAVVDTLGSAANGARTQLCGSVFRLTDDMLQRLAPLATMTPPLKSACIAMAAGYGEPWLLCLSSLATPQEFTQVLTHCDDKYVMKPFRLVAPPPCTTVQLSKAFSVLATVANWEDACIALNSAWTEIPVPEGVTPMTWVRIGSWWVPWAFSVGGMETDMACLKHMAQELGPTLSETKLTRYFAELVAACRIAQDRWTSAGRPAKLECPGITPGVGTWKIIIKLSHGKPQIFHVDSQYKKSAWVSQPK
ncbi:hypothetical protein ACFU9F_33585 [Streptomyces zhihengii]|uniref:hypothetical protein n=1 Tax=Streptomyces zhihengii TaxID=1818004 RepID=UPI003692595F